MGDMQSETRSAEEKFGQRLQEILERVMAKLQKDITPLKQQLMEAMVKKLKTDPDHVTSIAIGSENLEALEAYLIQTKTPYFPMDARDRENVIMLSTEDYQRVCDYCHSIEQLDARYTAYTDLDEFAKDSSLAGDRAVVTLSFPDTGEAREVSDELIDKIHAEGTGFAVGKGLSTDEDGNSVIKIAVRLNGAVDFDKNTPDLMQSLAELSIDQTNGLKTAVKACGHKIDEKNLSAFLHAVDTKTSMYLTDAFAPGTSGSLRYDAVEDRIFYKQPGTNFERVLMDKPALDELTKDPKWHKEIKKQLSHYTSFIHNMTAMTPEEKVKYEHLSKAELAGRKKEATDKTFDKLLKAASSNTPAKMEELFSVDEFSVRPEFDGKEFYSRLLSMEKKGKEVPKALVGALTLDVFKEDISHVVNDFVYSHKQVMDTYSAEGKVQYFKEHIMEAFEKEEEPFRSSFDRLHKEMPYAVDMVKANFRSAYSNIRVESVPSILAEFTKDKKKGLDKDKERDLDKEEREDG